MWFVFNSFCGTIVLSFFEQEAEQLKTNLGAKSWNKEKKIETIKFDDYYAIGVAREGQQKQLKSYNDN